MNKNSVGLLLLSVSICSMMMIGCGKKEKSEPRDNGSNTKVTVKNVVIGNNKTIKIGEQYAIEFDFTAPEELSTLSVVWQKQNVDIPRTISTTDNQLVGKKSGHFKSTSIFTTDDNDAGTWRLLISGDLPKAAVSFNMVDEKVTIVK